MNSVVELFRSLSWLRAIGLALITVGASGCSGESTRFGESPYASRSGQGEVTGSIPGQVAPIGRVESRPLPQTSQLPPPQSSAHPAPAASVVGGGGRGMASYTPAVAAYNSPAAPATYNPPPTQVAYNPAPGPEITGSVVAPASVVRKPASPGQWSWDGGTAITVAPGDTVEGIARRYGVPVTAVMAANNLASPNSIQAGQRLVIPRYGSSAAAAATPPQPGHVASPVVPKPAAAPALSANPTSHATGPVNSGVHVVAPGETLTKIAHQHGKSIAEVAKANNIPPYSKVSIGDRIIIPGVRIGSAKPEAEPAGVQSKPANKALASPGPAQSASVVSPAAETTSAESSVKAAAEATPGFRWPVRGRIIAGFGPKPNGQQNDGIDVAVPENTPVKAAEDGVVAYAGNELKGYGNLVLVRHPNGYVTAYAHAKELLVKRGDQIKRGDVIAKSGQSGNVDAPQLHFEVRKGSAPVDPMQFLGGV
jgi:murein DD-endopeptidase MepM/ murein hydrolase activator NlpD